MLKIVRTARSMNTVETLLCLTMALAATLFMFSDSAIAEDAITRDDLTIVIGGRLYDNWFAQLMLAPPETPHPSYPADGPASAADTWRCVTCHGWAYGGSDGAASPHRPTAPLFRGISGSAGADASRIRNILGDGTHRYTEDMLPPLALDALAKFVSAGQINVDVVIDSVNAKAMGVAKHGKRAFKRVCAMCHGVGGDALALESGGVRKTIGTLARFDPWRLLHKIRFGHPGAYMSGFANYSIEQLADILAYTQGLSLKRAWPKVSPKK